MKNTTNEPVGYLPNEEDIFNEEESSRDLIAVAPCSCSDCGITIYIGEQFYLTQDNLPICAACQEDTFYFANNLYSVNEGDFNDE